MADLVTSALVGKFQDAFAAVDTNNDGFIASSQLKQVLRSIGENPTDAAVQVISRHLCIAHYSYPSFSNISIRLDI